MHLQILIPAFTLHPSQRIRENLRISQRHLESFGAVQVVTAPPCAMIWQKERLLNRAVAHLPASIDTIAWIDGDLLFHNPFWVDQLARELERSRVVQLFSQVNRITEVGELGLAASAAKEPGQFTGAAWLHQKTGQESWVAPGYAWAARRELFSTAGGLYDADILGGGDSAAYHGWLNNTWNRHRNAVQQQHFETWLPHSRKYVQGKIGAIRGLITHLWHGTRENRQYVTRYEMLNRWGFDPSTMLRIDGNGCWAWTGAAPQGLRDDVAAYFVSRRDDG